MCIVRIANNINRNVYMHLNTRIFPTTGYARVLLFMFIRRELGGMVQDVYFSLHTVNMISWISSQNRQFMSFVLIVCFKRVMPHQRSICNLNPFMELFWSE